MNQENAQNAVNSAALILAALYFYRKLIEPATPAGGSAAPGRRGAGTQPTTLTASAEQFFGRGEVAPTGRFVVGWGFTFMVLSLTVGVAPKLAGSFAWLVALGAILGNGTQVAEDLQLQLNRTALPAAVDTSAPTVNVSFAGHPNSTLPQAPTTPRDRRPRQSTHPRTTIA